MSARQKSIIKRKHSRPAAAPQLAVFDIDGTIFRSSLLIELTRALVDADLFPPAALRTTAPAERRWRNRQGPYEAYIQAVVQTFSRHLAGVPQAAFLRVARRVVREQRLHTYRYTRDLAAKLHAQGFFLLAISHSPREIVAPFCRTLGFDEVYAQLFEVGPSGRYTGRRLYEDVIEDKGKVLRRAQAREGFSLRGSVGVGDTEADIRFLRLVDRPICFNPNAALYRVARRRGWRVIVERKDVVYTVQNGK
jgi:HAD superfamily phosphoserine phosphatase-like hydrolase